MSTDTTEKDKDRLLEIYKIHAVAADDVSRRRDGANRLFLAATTALVVTIGVIIRFGTGTFPVWLVIVGLAGAGFLIQCAWLGVLTSYKQLNSGKFKTLQDLEEMLPYAFYTREWERLQKGEDPNTYAKMTVAERELPRIFRKGFAVVGLTALAYGIWQCWLCVVLPFVLTALAYGIWSVVQN